MSKLMNRNFRVNFGRNLVGYAGLCAAIGVVRANHLITKMMRTRSFDRQKAIAFCDSLRKLDYVKGSFMIRQNVNL